MRMELRIDNYRRVIDTTDLELLGKWLVEQFTSIEWNNATQCEAFAYPGWHPDGTPDWITDIRIVGQRESVKTPEDVVTFLADQVRQLRALQAQDTP